MAASSSAYRVEDGTRNQLERGYTTESKARSHKSINNFWPPPLFIPVISVIQIICFVVWKLKADEKESWWYFCAGCFEDGHYSPWPFVSELKIELWRFVTSVFVHEGLAHLLVDVILQWIVGMPLEIEHRMYRVCSLYFLGTIVGNMLAYIASPGTTNLGASNAIQALLMANAASLIINWAETSHRVLKAVALGVLFVVSIASLILVKHFFSTDKCIDVGYTATIGSIVTGTLFGIFILRNLVEHNWERVLRRVCLVLFAIFFLTCVFLCITIKPTVATDECRAYVDEALKSLIKDVKN